MKAITLLEAGPPESFLVAEVPMPVVGDDDVLVRLRYASVNHGDVVRRKRGLFPPGFQPPYILGFEGSGRVVDVGKNVSGFRTDDRVGFLAESGAYAQFASIPQYQVFQIPQSVSDDAAAAATCVGTTAWHLLRVAGMKSGQTILVHGSGGGVGSMLVQFAGLLGVIRIATVGSPDKKRFAQSLRAEHVLVTSEDFGARALEITGGVGVDAIFDCVGQTVLDGNLKALRRGGTWMYYGSTSGHPAFPGGTILMNGLRIQGFVIFDVLRQSAAWAEGVAALLQALGEGRVSVHIDRVLRMEDVAEAHRLLEQRAVKGKILLALE